MKPFLIKLAGKKKFLRLLGEKGKGVNLRSGLVVLKPGEAIGEHITDNKEEAILFLEGKAKLYYSRRYSIIAGKNSFVYIPVNTRHDVKNIGRALLKYIYLSCPLK